MEYKFTDAKCKDDLNHITKVELQKINVKVSSDVIKRVISSRSKSLIKAIETKRKFMLTGIGRFQIKKYREMYLHKDNKVNTTEYTKDVFLNNFKVKDNV